MNVLETPTFRKKVKKLHKKQKAELDNAIREIVKDPSIGDQKRGDLADVWVYKFKMINELTLCAYTFSSDTIQLLALGSHENFYRDLKK